jgi:predicted DsbA family dithiol-disulfide isomerase
MQALLWRDYLCPWCYLGRDRTLVIEALGINVVPLAYDLHPEIPAGGRAVRPGGRLDRVLDHIAEECRDAGLPFNKPGRTPRTRLTLETAEVVRATDPAQFGAFDDAVYLAHWVEGRDIGDRHTLDELLVASSIDQTVVWPAVADGTGRALVDQSMHRARERGVTATPAWLVGELLIPGVQPRETVARWVGKLLEREAAPPR